MNNSCVNDEYQEPYFPIEFNPFEYGDKETLNKFYLSKFEELKKNKQFVHIKIPADISKKVNTGCLIGTNISSSLSGILDLLYKVRRSQTENQGKQVRLNGCKYLDGKIKKTDIFIRVVREHNQNKPNSREYHPDTFSIVHLFQKNKENGQICNQLPKKIIALNKRKRRLTTHNISKNKSNQQPQFQETNPSMEQPNLEDLGEKSHNQKHSINNQLLNMSNMQDQRQINQDNNESNRNNNSNIKNHNININNINNKNKINQNNNNINNNKQSNINSLSSSNDNSNNHSNNNDNISNSNNIEKNIIYNQDHKLRQNSQKNQIGSHNNSSNIPSQEKRYHPNKNDEEILKKWQSEMKQEHVESAPEQQQIRTQGLANYYYNMFQKQNKICKEQYEELLQTKIEIFKLKLLLSQSNQQQFVISDRNEIEIEE